jgi:ABC-type Fe3+-hydroxamate transport system substrate-binding protein
MTPTAADDLGTHNALSDAPQRLVSLVPNVSELLWWWHLADRVVGVTDWCVAPPRAFRSARRVRGTKNPDLAAIRALTPDLVIADQEENRAIDVERLRSAGLAVHVTRVRELADLPGTFARLGTALGVPEAAESTATAIARAVAGPPPTPPVRAVVGVWRDQDPRDGWWVLGRDTFGAALLASAGFRVLPDDPGGRYPVRGLEDLIAMAPDVVLLPDEPYAFGPGDVEELRARGVRVRPIDGTSLWWWGPRTPTAIGDLRRLARHLRRRRRPGRAGGQP